MPKNRTAKFHLHRNNKGLWSTILLAIKYFRKNKKQGTWCWCPNCNVDLCSNESFVSDNGRLGDNRVIYKCTNCNCESIWNFDIAPMPILISYSHPFQMTNDAKTTPKHYEFRARRNGKSIAHMMLFKDACLKGQSVISSFPNGDIYSPKAFEVLMEELKKEFIKTIEHSILKDKKSQIEKAFTHAVHKVFPRLISSPK